MNFSYLVVVASVLSFAKASAVPTSSEPTMFPAHAKGPVRLVQGPAKPAEPMHLRWARNMIFEPTLFPAHAKDPVRLEHGHAKPAEPVHPRWASNMI